MKLWPVILPAVLIGVSVSWTALRGAPWVPTSFKLVRRMLTLADVKPGEVVYDLGSGDGRLLVAAVRLHRAKAVGIEIDPLRYLWTQALITVLGLRGRITVLWGSFFDRDLSEADVVTLYLTEKTNARIVEKLRKELRPGTRVVSHSFTFPGWGLSGFDKQSDLFLYHV